MEARQPIDLNDGSFREVTSKLKKNTSRRRITDLVTDRNILQSVRRNLRLTGTDIARKITTPHKAAPSIRTIRRRAQTAGLHGRSPVKKPLLSAKHRKARILSAKTYHHCGQKEWFSGPMRASIYYLELTVYSGFDDQNVEGLIPSTNYLL
ncbi:Transposase [Popillia japonica]|uniref:Transposase n=1 Tax=Popillia japonica TaxID=7064 RepID=A0AAW1IA95_POPJA